jgi:hypothetical protein
MLFRVTLTIVSVLAAASLGAAPATAQSANAASDASEWVIGPIIGRRNHSIGMRSTPRRGGREAS